MKSQATHPNFTNWSKKEFDLDYMPEIKGKQVMVKGQIFSGAKFFPVSCVNINGFCIEIPVWLLKNNGLNHLI